MKTCTRCHETKPLSDFPPHKVRGHVSGVTSWCRACMADYQRTRRQDPNESARDRSYTRAVNRAQRALAKMHFKDYRRLLLAELQREGIA